MRASAPCVACAPFFNFVIVQLVALADLGPVSQALVCKDTTQAEEPQTKAAEEPKGEQQESFPALPAAQEKEGAPKPADKVKTCACTASLLLIPELSALWFCSLPALRMTGARVSRGQPDGKEDAAPAPATAEEPKEAEKSYLTAAKRGLDAPADEANKKTKAS